MFRLVDLPPDVPGRLYLHSMPGRYEPYQATVDAVRMRGISQVVCLTALEEIEGKAPDYARAVRRKDVPWQQRVYPIVDYGVPSDRASFLELVNSIAADLRRGVNILLHCAAGIGRTGTVASCVLVALGLTANEAAHRVKVAGSYAERPEQVELIQWVASQVAPSGRI
ncbi:MAG: protein-tyrosine phosphatase family protein [Anaerolineae bacterium]